MELYGVNMDPSKSVFELVLLWKEEGNTIRRPQHTIAT